MSLDGTGGRGPSQQDLLGLLQGPQPSGPDLDDLLAQVEVDAARRARLPKTGGLFGGGYAQFMADKAWPGVPATSVDPMVYAAAGQSGGGLIGGGYPLDMADAAEPAPAGGEQFDAMGLPIDAQVGDVAVDDQGNRQRYLGHDQGDARIWGGVDTTNVDPNSDAAVPTITVFGPKQPSPLADARDAATAEAPFASAGGSLQRQATSPRQHRPVLADGSRSHADDMSRLYGLLRVEEGERKDVYRDKLQVLTTGIGHKVLPSDGLKEGDIVTPERRAEFFRKDATKALNAARAQAAAAGITDSDFILRLASVNFQLGTDWTKEHKQTWALIKRGDYSAAAQEAARSKWNQQTPTRVALFQRSLRRLSEKRD